MSLFTGFKTNPMLVLLKPVASETNALELTEAHQEW